MQFEGREYGFANHAGSFAAEEVSRYGNDGFLHAVAGERKEDEDGLGDRENGDVVFTDPGDEVELEGPGGDFDHMADGVWGADCYAFPKFGEFKLKLLGTIDLTVVVIEKDSE